MKPHLHANISAKRFGGVPEDYMAIHEFMDHSKASFPDMRHRAMLHSSWGIYVVSQVFGNLLTLSNGKQVSVRDVAEEHVIEDLGFIPTVQDWLKDLPIEGWMSGTKKRRKVMSFNETPESKETYVD